LKKLTALYSLTHMGQFKNQFYARMPSMTPTPLSTRPYDVIVIGGGPSGMMAAGRAAERGARVLLLEKNPGLGKKLLITGGGRCNVTNAEFDTRRLLAHYNDSAKFLFSAFARYGVANTLDFFHQRGMPTKVEEYGRVFPVSDSAASVHHVLSEYLRAGGVTVKTNATVAAITAHSGTIDSVTLASDDTLTARSFILATGGTSRPETGSTGDGFRWLRELGHTVHDPDPSLVPIALQADWAKPLAGLTLSDVIITALQYEQRAVRKRGRILFTHVGVSGPTILNMSKAVGELLDYGPVTLSLDLFPALDHGALDTALITHFTTKSNTLCKNALSHFLPTSLIAPLMAQTGIVPETICHSITKEARKALVQLLKDVRLPVRGLLGADKAIVTSGGVDLTEVDFKTMRSRRFSNLYLTGDILNIDRPSGGYSLQLCWTTGYVAGDTAGGMIEPNPHQ
jgi:predicted Rossmann fold flavoprotein